MTRRVVPAACLVALLASASLASAQGRAPRSPSDRAVDMRGGAPDLALDSRVAASGPTATSNTDGEPWTRRDTGLVLIWVGLPVLAGSAILAGVATDAAGHRDSDEGDSQSAEEAATTFGITAGIAGGVGLLLLVPGLVLVFEDQPVVTARAEGGGASLTVRF